MDLRGEVLKTQERRKTKLSFDDDKQIADYVTWLLENHAGNQMTTNKVMNDIMILISAFDNGDVVAINRILDAAIDSGFVAQIPNWPSKTGNPSGGNRTNAPERK